MAEGLAAKTGKIRIGDRILSVNGVNIVGASHEEAVNALIRATKEVVLTIRHEQLPSGWKVNAYTMPFDLLVIYQHFLHRNLSSISSLPKSLA